MHPASCTVRGDGIGSEVLAECRLVLNPYQVFSATLGPLQQQGHVGSVSVCVVLL